MLYDAFDLDKDLVKVDEKPFISLFDARVVEGLLEVPPFGSDAVRKPVRV
jgi:CRISPR-associated protein Cas5d